MTLQDIVTQALHRLKRSSDSQNLQKYQPEFLFSVNEGVKLIAARYHQSRKDTVALTSGVFTKTLLSRKAYEIIDVLAADKSVTFSEEYAGSGTYEVDTDETSVAVIYRFVPAELSNSIDEPEIPEEFHGMLVNYVVANERANGDPSLQSAAKTDFDLFYSKLNNIVPCDIPTVLTGYFT